MGKYKTERVCKQKQGGSYTSWIDSDSGILFCPEGIIILGRRFGGSDAAQYGFIANGIFRRYIVTPVPTQFGLARMARRKLKEVIKEQNQ